MNVRGRRVAIGVVVVGAMIFVWAGIAFQEKLVEQWYLWKLDSPDKEDQELAAEKLGQMGSRRAIPRLVEILRRAPKQGRVQSVALGGTRLPTTVRIWDATTGEPFLFSGSVIWDKATGKGITGAIRSHYSFEALVRIGRPAVPALSRLLEDTDEENRLAAAAALKEIDPLEFEKVAAPSREILKVSYE